MAAWPSIGPAEDLAYAPAPVDNPLKGLVPYAGDVADRFPHSMEFDYLPLSALVVGPGRYDWQPLERLLDEIAGRGHQVVFRVYMEYPGKKGAIPGYLVKDGLKVHRYLNTNTQPFPSKQVETPDYEDPRLRAMLAAFISALGERYDGDPRIGFITAGLLGTWGEWHTYPRDELFASKRVQIEVMDAYEKAFLETPILLRYPAGADDFAHAPNHDRRFGYHDDSFAWATLDTGRPEDDWFFVPALTRAGQGALDRWKSSPIGGEIRPEAWGRIFDEDPGFDEIQDFTACVVATHATWLMDSGLFEEPPAQDRRDRAERLVRRLGYEFHASRSNIVTHPDRMVVEVRIENRGVAPFYRNWTAEFAALRADSTVARRWPSELTLTGILPDESRTWVAALDTRTVPAGRYRLAVRIPNPLAKGHPLRFANRENIAGAEGWLVLGEYGWEEVERSIVPPTPLSSEKGPTNAVCLPDPGANDFGCRFGR